MIIYDNILIGGGPTGLYLAKLLEENNKDYLLIESFQKLGGQCIQIYPNKIMYDIPGLGPISGSDFINLLKSSLKNKKINLNEHYLSYSLEKNLFKIITNKKEYFCKNLILTTGMGTVVFNKPILDNLEKYENKQIFYFPCDSYENKKILVFGGGDSALDAVDFLKKKNEVSLIHRRLDLKIINSPLLKNIKTYIPYKLVKLEEKNNLLTGVTIENENSFLKINTDLIFFCYGYSQKNLVERIPISINDFKNKDGVFIIGGANFYKEKRNYIAIGMWEARIILNFL